MGTVRSCARPSEEASAGAVLGATLILYGTHHPNKATIGTWTSEPGLNSSRMSRERAVEDDSCTKIHNTERAGDHRNAQSGQLNQQKLWKETPKIYFLLIERTTLLAAASMAAALWSEEAEWPQGLWCVITVTSCCPSSFSPPPSPWCTRPPLTHTSLATLAQNHTSVPVGGIRVVRGTEACGQAGVEPHCPADGPTGAPSGHGAPGISDGLIVRESQGPQRLCC